MLPTVLVVRVCDIDRRSTISITNAIDPSAIGEGSLVMRVTGLLAPQQGAGDT